MPAQVSCDGQVVELKYAEGPNLRARLLAPARSSRVRPTEEVVESNQHYLWLRFHVPGGRWPRIIEVRTDSGGGAVVGILGQPGLPDKRMGSGPNVDSGQRLHGRCGKAAKRLPCVPG